MKRRENSKETKMSTKTKEKSEHKIKWWKNSAKTI